MLKINLPHKCPSLNAKPTAGCLGGVMRFLLYTAIAEAGFSHITVVFNTNPVNCSKVGNLHFVN